MSIAIRFLRRRNLGNFEHTELEITDSVEDRNMATDVTKGLMGFVKDALYETGAFSKSAVMSNLGTDEVKVVDTTPKALAKTKVEPAKKVETAKVETEIKAGGSVSEVKPTEAVKVEVKVEATQAEVAKTETVAKTEPKPRAKETKTVVKASKATAYDRNLDSHKNNLGVFLDSSFPGWRKPENLKKAGVASRELQGSEFLDGEGNILQSFKDAFSKHMVNLV